MASPLQGYSSTLTQSTSFFFILLRAHSDGLVIWASLPTVTILEGRTPGLSSTLLSQSWELMMCVEVAMGLLRPSSWLRRQKGNLAQHLHL